MKILILYYSKTGVTKEVGEKLKNNLETSNHNVHIEEIIDMTNRKGFFNFFKAGKDAMQASLTEIKKINSDISSYDIVIIGSPVWAGKITPAVRTFLKENISKIKKPLFFLTANSNSFSTAINNYEELSPSFNKTLTISKKERKNSEVFIDKIQKFIAENC